MERNLEKFPQSRNFKEMTSSMVSSGPWRRILTINLHFIDRKDEFLKRRKIIDSLFVGNLILKSVIIGSVDRADYEMARRSYRLRSARFHLPRSSRHMCLDCAKRPVFNQSRISADKYFLKKISSKIEKKCVQHCFRNSPFSHKKASFSSWHLQLQNCDSWNKRASRCN